ncbi:putative gustatory receptor 59b [Drosophila yakuba]|nr:putative gustatory receptor 59b [Drosophila yakuba]XP_039228230.1 putative gustatory receptor 59b [Drosophila yakuba]XP_039228231.1 putative gustatory receptor 59b [Drosophila yakuba]XP_039228232.1 putative gustatory receptor 59b [Drosophila yakuba]
MEKLVGIYHGYAQLIGLTSYRIVGGELKKSRMTEAYVLAWNIGTVFILAWMAWSAGYEDIKEMMMASLFPEMMSIIPLVVYSVNYAVIVYILISRPYRDSMLYDLMDITNQLSRKMALAGRKTNLKLKKLLYLKSFALTYLTLGSFISLLFLKKGYFEVTLMGIAYSILNVSNYFYFTSFWQIVRGYDFVDQEIKNLTTTKSGSHVENFEEELRDLWSFHWTLSRMASRISRVYGVQMIVSRTEYVLFSVVFGYVGIICMFQGLSLNILHVGLIYLVRTLDFFLIDVICDMTARYQNQPKHELVEGELNQKALSAYLIYESSMRLDLKVCGLYFSNRGRWLEMMGAIACHATLLLQFHLTLSK